MSVGSGSVQLTRVKFEQLAREFVLRSKHRSLEIVLGFDCHLKCDGTEKKMLDVTRNDKSLDNIQSRQARSQAKRPDADEVLFNSRAPRMPRLHRVTRCTGSDYTCLGIMGYPGYPGDPKSCRPLSPDSENSENDVGGQVCRISASRGPTVCSLMMLLGMP